MSLSSKSSASAEILALSVVLIASTIAAATDSGAIQQTPSSTDYYDTAPEIVVGFVGGFIHRDDERRSEVQLAQRLRAAYGKNVFAAVFENHHKKKAYRAILEMLDANHDGVLSPLEKHNARIVLYGHSWGGSTVVSLAQDLQRDGVPVLLTVQVDSISRFRAKDSVIPANVARAVNFYQTHGLIHGQPKIVAADSARTKIIGNYRMDYKKPPEECRVYPWYDHHWIKGHEAIECDPQLWSQVEGLIRGQLAAHPAENLAKSR